MFIQTQSTVSSRAIVHAESFSITQVDLRWSGFVKKKKKNCLLVVKNSTVVLFLEIWKEYLPTALNTATGSRYYCSPLRDRIGNERDSTLLLSRNNEYRFRFLLILRRSRANKTHLLHQEADFSYTKQEGEWLYAESFFASVPPRNRDVRRLEIHRRRRS